MENSETVTLVGITPEDALVVVTWGIWKLNFKIILEDMKCIYCKSSEIKLAAALPFGTGVRVTGKVDGNRMEVNEIVIL
jgi:hypothetical protein